MKTYFVIVSRTVQSICRVKAETPEAAARLHDDIKRSVTIEEENMDDPFIEVYDNEALEGDPLFEV